MVPSSKLIQNLLEVPGICKTKTVNSFKLHLVFMSKFHKYDVHGALLQDENSLPHPPLHFFGLGVLTTVMHPILPK